MKTFLIVCAQVLLVVGMMCGGLVWGQHTAGVHNWGNPYEDFCKERCGDTLRRHFEFEIDNSFSYSSMLVDSVIFNRLEVKNKNGTNQIVSSKNIIDYAPIELPKLVQQTSKTGNPCLSEKPIPAIYAAGIRGAQYPFIIPPHSKYYFLVEIKIILCPDDDSIIPNDLYLFDWTTLVHKQCQSCIQDTFNSKVPILHNCPSLRQSQIESSYSQIKLKSNIISSDLKLNISLLQNANLKFSIFDPKGSKVLFPNKEDSFISGVTDYSLNISSLPAGIYFLSVKSRKKHHLLKFIKI